jgi:hypothetical protein
VKLAVIAATLGVTGDGVHDVAIRSDEGQLGVATQCPRHDVDACASSS